MQNLFAHASSYWVRYNQYEIKTGKNGRRYIMAAPAAEPKVYDPLKDSEKLVVDALNVGMLCMVRKSEAVIEQAVLEFVHQYGLLGLMTALPTTPSFMDYEAVYLPKNRFIKAESMQTEAFLSLFYPFEKLDVVKESIQSSWNINQDRAMMALAMTFAEQPMAMNMQFQRQYAEPYEWSVQQFKDWAFTLTSSFLFYHDYDQLDEASRNTYRMGMAAFGGIAPTYHIALFDKPAATPTIVWDFHSLLTAIQLMFSFMLTDEEKPLRLCEHCQKAFVASRANNVFCSPQCKNQHNVYKNRAKNRDRDEKQ